MISLLDRHLPQGRGERPDVPGTPPRIDVHCHCLPAFDDGPRDLSESLDLCRALVGQGITAVVASPHQLGRFDGCYTSRQIRQGVQSLNGTLGREGIRLTVLPGAEIRIDERLLEMVQNDQVMTLADAHQYILLELPYEVFLDLGPLLRRLGESGLRGVLAHPERNTVLARDPERVLEWARYAPVLQVTGASLAGLFGPSCMRAAWAFLDAPLPCVVATDAHNTGARAPLFGDAFRTIASRRGVVCAEKVCLENPRALILGWRPRAAGGDRPAARWEAGYGRTGGVRS